MGQEKGDNQRREREEVRHWVCLQLNKKGRLTVSSEFKREANGERCYAAEVPSHSCIGA